jgi:predicted transcriptional regulator of viral defense system
MKVIPYEVLYEPRFTYLWTLAEERFPTELNKNLERQEAVYKIARRFLETCGMTLRADLSKAVGVSRREAGLANQRLVDEGFAERIAPGVYRLRKEFPEFN